MYIRKVHGLKTESWRTPANTDEQFKHKSLSTTFWDLLFNKLFRRLRKFHDIPIHPILNSKASCHTLSNA